MKLVDYADGSGVYWGFRLAGTLGWRLILLGDVPLGMLRLLYLRQSIDLGIRSTLLVRTCRPALVSARTVIDIGLLDLLLNVFGFLLLIG